MLSAGCTQLGFFFLARAVEEGIDLMGSFLNLFIADTQISHFYGMPFLLKGLFSEILGGTGMREAVLLLNFVSTYTRSAFRCVPNPSQFLRSSPILRIEFMSE